MVSGTWNWTNGVAGLINLITICGWTGIVISRDSSKDMILPDWPVSTIANMVGDHHPEISAQYRELAGRYC